MSYSKLKSLVANVEAIATAMKVRIDDRQATDEEKEVLSRYSGFGGIKDVLNIGTEHTVSDDVAEPIFNTSLRSEEHTSELQSR